MNRFLSPLLAAAIFAPIALPVAAQQARTGTESPATATTPGQSSNTQASGTDARPDALIATVGDAKITAGDVQTAIEAFPPQLSQQVPTQQQISTAVDQLILRELILQHAMQNDLADDPAVRQLVEENSQLSREDAIVQAYVQRELEGAVTDEAVQNAYDEADAQTEQQLPPIEEVRPQMEQQIRKQRLAQLRQNLMGMGTAVTFYDQSGEPVEDGQADPMSGSSSSTRDAESNNNSRLSNANSSNSGSPGSNESSPGSSELNSDEAESNSSH